MGSSVARLFGSRKEEMGQLEIVDPYSPEKLVELSRMLHSRQTLQEEALRRSDGDREKTRKEMLKYKGKVMPDWLVSRRRQQTKFYNAAQVAILSLENQRMAVETVVMAQEQMKSTQEVNAALASVREQYAKVEEMVETYEETMEFFSELNEQMMAVPLTDLPTGRGTLGDFMGSGRSLTAAEEAELFDEEEEPARPPPVVVTPVAQRNLDELRDRMKAQAREESRAPRPRPSNPLMQ
jgi:hypothetical protein